MRMALVFELGDGLHLTGVPTAARSTYTIEIWFEFDAVDSYRRIMSFGPNDSDTGLYVQDGYLDLYPNKESAAAVVSANQWVKVRITRSGATKVTSVYLNGVRKIRHTGTANDYLLSGGEAIFFVDDGGENGSGTVARIKVWDRVVAP